MARSGPSSGRKAGAGSGRKEKPEKEEEESGSYKRRGKKDGGWPLWLWGVGAFGLLACCGRVFAGDEKPVAKSKSTDVASTEGGAEAGSTVRYLELAMRLSEMTTVASALQSGNVLDAEAFDVLTKELDNIESEIKTMDGNIARDLRSMVSVIRGTLYQHSNNLTDEQVQNLNNSWTYANPNYWEDYYKKTKAEERFDWYGSWDSGVDETVFTPHGVGQPKAATTLGDFVRPYIDASSKILMLGCGNSDMSEKMYVAGFEDIVNIDVSKAVVDGLKERLETQMPRMRWQVEDASAMSFDAASFDVTIDKGTLDAIEQNQPLLHGAIKEAHRTLKPGGAFISVTFNNPTIRVERQMADSGAEWGSCLTHSFNKTRTSDMAKQVYYVHVCKRP
eukprot:gnl/TRDRNA2_/TRDRNA2_190913_c0_seq1.p1 gnl/TRDRNA2_/TRDRNA2_190913_c0~~gnl/TRDRNA2_/TRDRNA2_190913_c0_seq1.p1  ORF type:complete len:391 (+),score=91.17 gnl/TRDRNA2_/TRDRNA2_190913_c0_seq1:98-1270(+)